MNIKFFLNTGYITCATSLYLNGSAVVETPVTQSLHTNHSTFRSTGSMQTDRDYEKSVFEDEIKNHINKAFMEYEGGIDVEQKTAKDFAVQKGPGYWQKRTRRTVDNANIKVEQPILTESVSKQQEGSAPEPSKLTLAQTGEVSKVHTITCEQRSTPKEESSPIEIIKKLIEADINAYKTLENNVRSITWQHHDDRVLGKEMLTRKNKIYEELLQAHIALDACKKELKGLKNSQNVENVSVKNAASESVVINNISICTVLQGMLILLAVLYFFS